MLPILAKHSNLSSILQCLARNLALLLIPLYLSLLASLYLVEIVLYNSYHINDFIQAVGIIKQYEFKFRVSNVSHIRF